MRRAVGLVGSKTLNEWGGNISVAYPSRGRFSQNIWGSKGSVFSRKSREPERSLVSYMPVILDKTTKMLSGEYPFRLLSGPEFIRKLSL